MLWRFLFRSLVLAGIVLACVAHLVWNGWHAKRVVAENQPHLLLSSGKRDVDLWSPSYAFGRVYDLTFLRAEKDTDAVMPDARLKIQLASNGRTRFLVVREGHPNANATWWDVLTRREKLQMVADREWIDLGPAPRPGEALDVQVQGLLPGPFGFSQLFSRERPHFARLRVVRPDSPRARVTNTTLRYRFENATPVAARETLARFFFFPSCSRVLQVTALVAFALLFAGWWWLWEEKYARAVASLVPAVTLLHVCCLPPFQGADEVAHEATVEALLWNPSMLQAPPAIPESLSLVYAAIGYDRFAGDPGTPVDMASPERRAALGAVLRSRYAEEARVPVAATPDDQALDPSKRASLYYNAFRVLGPLLRALSVLDRLEAYVVLSAVASLFLFGAGLLLLVRLGIAAPVQLAYGLAALLPYSVGVVASCSNYSLAIGIGQFLAACLVGGVLADSVRRRLLAAVLFTVASLLGVGVWDDFVFFAVPSALALTLLAAHAAYHLQPESGRRLATRALPFVGVLLSLAIVFALATGRIRHAISSFGARLPKSLGGFEDPSLWLLLAAAAAPFVVSLVLALAIVRSRELSENRRRHAARIRSAALAAIFVVMFLVTPWRAVPFENLRLDYPDEVAAHWSAFWSSNFAFDQDVLSWKMYWGVFGYADVFYPDTLYALARWACVALFLALPVLSWRFTARDPGRSMLLLVVSGYALAACVVTNSVRFFALTNPWGRFILPAFPLVALPLLTRAATPERVFTLRPAVALFVALHAWTAIVLLGSRYAVGR